MGEEYRLLSPSLCSFLHSLVTSSLLGPNILLSTIFANTLNLHSSIIVSDQVSHPYKTAGKIIVLQMLIFVFLDSKLAVHADITHKSCMFFCSIFPSVPVLRLMDSVTETCSEKLKKNV
jgi:hypothetical protein